MRPHPQSFASLAAGDSCVIQGLRDRLGDRKVLEPSTQQTCEPTLPAVTLSTLPIQEGAPPRSVLLAAPPALYSSVSNLLWTILALAWY